MTYRYFIELAYNGSAYHGWQVQPNATTVQSELNQKISTVLGSEISVTGAGRTDTGVHAKFFVAHFDTNLDLTRKIPALIHKLNSFLPADIAIRRIYPVKPEVHARFSALSRTYEYHISTRKDPFLREYAWQVNFQLDLKKMNDCASILKEYTDFTSFSKSHTDVKTNNCRIMHARWESSGTELVFTIQADRFLRNMVRAIVGTLVEVGRGRITPLEFRTIIESKNRSRAGESVPAHALFLTNIEYPAL